MTWPATVCYSTWGSLIVILLACLACAEDPPRPVAAGQPTGAVAVKPASAEPAGSNDAEGMGADPLRTGKHDAGYPERMAWWKDARFGMFLCWSPAAQNGLGDDGWNIAWNRISWDDYDKMARKFQPKAFEPAKIAKQIKACGVKYVVFTTKHHAGFSMWDSKQTEFNIVEYHGKDILKPLCDALRAEGLRVGLYFSAWDWNRKEYRGVPKDAKDLNRQRGGVSVEEGNTLWPKFLDFYLAQAKELLTGYGKIDVLWIDGWKKHGPDRWASRRLWDLVRAKQPQCILNDRWADLERADFITAENHVPGTDLGRPWETCYRANGGWFYTKTPYRPARDHVRMLVMCVSRNGNLLLNFPLNEQGAFDADAVTRMKEVGGWLKANGASVYGCGAASLRATPWGSATYKAGHLYLHVYSENHDPDQPIIIEGLTSNVLSAKVLSTGASVAMSQTAGDAVLTLPTGTKIDPVGTVIDVAVGEPVTVRRDRFITEWTAVAALPGRAFHKSIGPEGKLDASKSLEYGGKAHNWRPLAAGKNGFVDLKSLASDKYGVAFTAVDVISDRDCSTELLFGAGDHATVYLNGAKVLAARGAQPIGPDTARARINLPAGRSTLVVKSLGRSGPWGFHAWIAGGKRLRFEPTKSMAFVGGDPASWANADVVVWAAEAERLKGTDLLPQKPGLMGVRMRPRDPPDSTGIVATVKVPRALTKACVLVRYGHVADTEVGISVDGRPPVKVKLPKTRGWRSYETVLAPFGALPAGEHKIHVYTTVNAGAYHFEGVAFAEGEPLGTSVRLAR